MKTVVCEIVLAKGTGFPQICQSLNCFDKHNHTTMENTAF